MRETLPDRLRQSPNPDPGLSCGRAVLLTHFMILQFVVVSLNWPLYLPRTSRADDNPTNATMSVLNLEKQRNTKNTIFKHVRFIVLMAKKYTIHLYV